MRCAPHWWREDSSHRLGSLAWGPKSSGGAFSSHFAEIMKVLGLDLTDDSLAETPQRVAKMYVGEIFGGLNTNTFLD